MEGYTLEQAEEEIADLRGTVQKMSEILTLVNGTNSPNTPAGAVALFASGGQPNYINPAGLTMGLVGAQNATFPAATVTGTTVTTIGSGTIPGGDAEIGAVYDVECWGNGVWDATTRTALNFQVSLGGTAMASVQLGTIWFSAVAAMAFRFRVRGRVICNTTGASGTWTSLINGEVSAFGVSVVPGSGTAQDTGGFASCESTTTTTKDTTASQVLAVQTFWGGAATSGQTITGRVAVFQRIA